MRFAHGSGRGPRVRGRREDRRGRPTLRARPVREPARAARRQPESDRSYKLSLWTRGSSRRSARSSSGSSFSQAAERLGVTQPAVSLQIRALEKRLGTQLLDRSGRRVEPTEAGMRLYRGAQRLLALEEQVVAEVAEESGEELDGTFEIGASTGPGGIVLSQLLCEFQGAPPGAARRAVGLRHADDRRAGRGARARARRRRRRAAAPRRRLRAVLPRRGDPRLPAEPPVRRQDRGARRPARRGPDRDAGGRGRAAADRGRAAPRRDAAARPRRAARARAAGVGDERRPCRATA